MNMNVKHEELTVRALYDLSYTAARPLLEACTYPVSYTHLRAHET